jgi:hypothetical protein
LFLFVFPDPIVQSGWGAESGRAGRVGAGWRENKEERARENWLYGLRDGIIHLKEHPNSLSLCRTSAHQEEPSSGWLKADKYINKGIKVMQPKPHKKNFQPS